MANKISVIIDVVTDKANTAIGGFKKSVQDAEGATGKFKAGATSAFDSVKANVGEMALAGGAALVTFGIQSVSAFQDIALEAGLMSEALKMPVEDASRLIEVAGDLGIEADALEGTIGKMNLTAGKTPGYFDEIGASIVRNKDGTMNVKDTFLATVDALNAIPDAGKRAEAAQRIFGKGWKEIAELVGQGSKDIVESMAEVSDAKIISEDEVAKAREYREAMDTLKDSLEDVMLVVGEELVPVLSDLAGGIAGIQSAAEALPDFGSEDSFAGSMYNAVRNAVDPVHALRDGVQTLGEVFGDTTDDVEAAGKTWDTSRGKLGDMSASSIEAAESAVRLADEHKRIADESKNTQRGLENVNEELLETERDANRAELALAELRGEMSDRAGFLNIQAGFESVETLGAEAWLAVATGAEDAEAKARDYELAQIDLKEEIIGYAEEIGNVPPEKLTTILTAIDEGELAWAEAQIELLTRPRTIYSNIKVLGSGELAPAQTGRRALGGPVAGGGLYQVGEGGKPEILEQNGKQYLIPGDSGQVTPFRSGGGMGGGSPIYLTVNAGLGVNGPQLADQIVALIEEHNRRNGK